MEWHQEEAEKLLIKTDECDRVCWLGGNFSFFPDSIASYLRAPAGHHEDFFEALANLHCTMERHIRRRAGEDAPEPYAHPSVELGVAGMRFVRAAVESSRARGAWTAV